MAKAQDSLPKSVELTMDECHLVVLALECYADTRKRAARANAQDVEMSALYMSRYDECVSLARKF